MEDKEEEKGRGGEGEGIVKRHCFVPSYCFSLFF